MRSEDGDHLNTAGDYNAEPSDRQMSREECCRLRDKQNVFQHNETLKVNFEAFGKTIVQFL